MLSAGPRRHAVALLLASGLALGCADNATRLSHAIERHAAARQDTDDPVAQEILYVPRSNPHRPYFLVFFPEHRVEPGDLEAAGLPRALASRIYSEMGYLSVGEAPFLVVIQDGGALSFTTHWRQFALVPEVLVIPGERPTRLRLRPGERGMIVEAAE